MEPDNPDNPDNPDGPDHPDGPTPRPLPAHHERAHLSEPGDRSHQIHRYLPSDGLGDLVGRYWIPVWSLPDGAEATQHVLQYPVAVVAVDAHGARFAGVASGVSSITLRARGWTVGILFRPAAGTLLTGGSMASWTDRTASLAQALGSVRASGVERAVAQVRSVMADDPHAADAHQAAIGALEPLLWPFVPIDDEGALVNEVVSFVEADGDVVRVAQICDRFAIGERSLQRLTRRRLGITPKWLIRRRRLHEATDALRNRTASIAEIAAQLGYADQAHLTRDLRATTSLTPAELARRYRARADEEA